MRSAIENRISRRKYEKEPLTSSEMKMIIEKVNQANKTSGLNAEFLEDGSAAFGSFKASYGMFNNVRSLLLMKGKKSDKDLREKVGYYGEELVLDITDMGLGTCWVAGTFDRKSITIAEDEELVCVITVGKVGVTSFKERFLRGGMHRKMKTIEERSRCDQPMPQWMRSGMEAVLLAPSAVNSQKAFFVYEKGSVYGKVKDSYVMDMVDLGIAKKHFEIEAGGTFELGNGSLFHKE